MLMPSIFGDSFMDDFFDFPEVRPAKIYHQNQLMKTDIFQTKDGYEITMDLPGYKKEDVTAELKDGYLVITASTRRMPRASTCVGSVTAEAAAEVSMWAMT